MLKKLSADLIRRQATEVQDIELSDERADELAGEVRHLNETVLDAARELEFDDEPAGFLRALVAAAPDGSNKG